MHYNIYTLPKTTSKFAPENRPKPERKRIVFQVSGAFDVSFRECKLWRLSTYPPRSRTPPPETRPYEGLINLWIPLVSLNKALLNHCFWVGSVDLARGKGGWDHFFLKQACSRDVFVARDDFMAHFFSRFC